MPGCEVFLYDVKSDSQWAFQVQNCVCKIIQYKENAAHRYCF